MFTIDASVWLNADAPHEPEHAHSRLFLDRVASTKFPVFVPDILLVEVTAAISRVRGDSTLAIEYAQRLRSLDFVHFVKLEEPMLSRAVELAAAQKLRGADAIYAAVAAMTASTLISLDREHLSRVSPLVRTLTPAEALTQMSDVLSPPK